MENRFDFGRNWRRLLEQLDEPRIDKAMSDLKDGLAGADLRGLSFLDIGSGSGIHSLAAHRLGAKPIRSFDYDLDSVACTQAVHARDHAPASWSVEHASALDASYLESLGQFDVVYSWGVLHHTGAMWDAIRLTSQRTKPGGLFFIGIYNEKKPATEIMKRIKRTYSASGPLVRSAIKWSYWGAVSAASSLRGISVRDQVRDPSYGRGMDYWRDLEDWVGGWPYECATPAAVIDFVSALGFDPLRHTEHGSFAAVNEFLFRRA